MCLPDLNTSQPGTSRRRRLAAMAILLATMSLGIGFLHPQPGPGADFFDFLRGLMVGGGLVFSIAAFRLCVRRPRGAN